MFDVCGIERETPNLVEPMFFTQDMVSRAVSWRGCSLSRGEQSNKRCFALTPGGFAQNKQVVMWGQAASMQGNVCDCEPVYVWQRHWTLDYDSCDV